MADTSKSTGIPVPGSVPPKPTQSQMAPEKKEEPVLDRVKEEQDAGQAALRLFESQASAEQEAGRAAVAKAAQIASARQAYQQRQLEQGPPPMPSPPKNPLHGV